MNRDRSVFIVDDDQAMRESVRSLVAALKVETKMFGSAEEFLNAYDPEQAGCLVTDLRMMGMTGVELLQRLNAMGLHIPTVIVSGYADVPITVQAMQQGAITLLEKPVRAFELYDAIRRALEIDVQRRQRRDNLREVQQRMESLTDKEQLVMGLVLEGLPNKAIAHRLDVSIRTVEARRKNVFQKMGVNTAAELALPVTEVRMLAQSEMLPDARLSKAQPRA